MTLKNFIKNILLYVYCLFKIYQEYFKTFSDAENLKNTITRPDTRPSVADGWAGAEISVFDSCSRTDRPTDGRTDGRTKPLIELRVRN